jgi:hypothetical protein
VYQEIPAKIVRNVPCFSLSQNYKTYPCLKFNGYGDTDKRSFKESALLHPTGKYCQLGMYRKVFLKMKMTVFLDVALYSLIDVY